MKQHVDRVVHHLQDVVGLSNIQKLRGESRAEDESVRRRWREVRRGIVGLRRRRVLMQRDGQQVERSSDGGSLKGEEHIELTNGNGNGIESSLLQDDVDLADRFAFGIDDGDVVFDDSSSGVGVGGVSAMTPPAIDEDTLQMQYEQLKEDLKEMELKTPYMLMFRVPADQANDLLASLESIGVGVEFGIIDVAPLEVTRPPPPPPKEIPSDVKGKKKGIFGAMSGKRLMTDLLYHQIRSDSVINADFLLYILAGAVIAAIGLGTNNYVAIVASMLVSPLMGPIVGFTFGSVVRDLRLVATAVITELIGVSLAFLCGILAGVCMSALGVALEWPNMEMHSRGTWEAQLIGIAIAIPSGVGVAVSISAGGTNPLIGVAISASLLPPVVNSGMTLVYSIIGPWMHGAAVDRLHFLTISGFSMLLFVLNLLCIYVTGVLTFILKSVRPFRRKTSENFEGIAEHEHEYFDIPRLLRLNANMVPLNMLPPMTRSAKMYNLAAGGSSSAHPSPLLTSRGDNGGPKLLVGEEGKEVKDRQMMRSVSDDILRPALRVNTSITDRINTAAYGALSRTVSDPLGLNRTESGALFRPLEETLQSVAEVSDDNSEIVIKPDE